MKRLLTAALVAAIATGAFAQLDPRLTTSSTQVWTFRASSTAPTVASAGYGKMYLDPVCGCLKWSYNGSAFTGMPMAPNQFVASFNGRTAAVVPTSGDYSVAQVTGAAPLASPTFTGTVTIPSPWTLGATSITVTGTEINRLAGVSSNVQTQIDGKAATVHAHAQADVTNLTSDLALKAPLASPAFTGVPTAPTPTGGDNSTKIATTAFVQANTNPNAADKTATNVFTASTASPIRIKPASAPAADTKLLDVQATGAGSSLWWVDAEGDGTGQNWALNALTVTSTITGSISGTATALAADPADCTGSNFAKGITASGAATCAQPATSDLSDASNVPLKNVANVFTATQQVTVPTATSSGVIVKTSDNNTTNRPFKVFNSTDAEVFAIGATGRVFATPGTSAAPGYAFVGDEVTGMYRSSANILAFAASSAFGFALPTNFRMIINGGGMALSSDTPLGWDSATSAGSGGNDLVLRRGGAGILRQILSTNAQRMEIYNTSDSNTSPTNYERVEIGANPCGIGANQFGVMQCAGGTGAARHVWYGTTSSSGMFIRTVNVDRYKFDESGDIVPQGTTRTLEAGDVGAQFKTVYTAAEQGGWTKDLTAGSPTAFAQFGVASGSSVSGSIEYEIFATDGTDHQSRSGTLHFTAVNKAGTETCTLFRPDGGTTVDQTTDGFNRSDGASTLTNAFTCTTAAANAITVNANAVSSLAETALRITWRPTISGNGSTTNPATATVTPQ